MTDAFDLRGKVALVTGGSRGLGRAIATGFAAHGADIIVASRKLDNCLEVAREVEAMGRRALAISCHMGHWNEIESLFEQAWGAFGRLDILVNNAGMSPVVGRAVDTTEELFDKVVALNFKGPFRLGTLVGERMARAGGGSIINISSVGAIRPRPEYAPYAGSKAALNAITEALAFEYAPKVRVNAIMPGSFRTDIAKHWPPEKEQSVTSAIKRYGEPEEIVTAALYLASDHSSFTTGSVIRVDGGRP